MRDNGMLSASCFVGLFLALSVVFFTGCATTMSQMPNPNEVRKVTPIDGVSGKYKSPYTSDGTIAEWVKNGTAVEAGSYLGSAAGVKAGMELAGRIPVVGSYFGRGLGGKIGREAALKLVGGEAFIAESSDLSFDSLKDMSIYMYSNFSETDEYKKVLDLTQGIYPELLTVYDGAVRGAKISH